MTIVTTGFPGIQHRAAAPSAGNTEAALDTGGLFEELLAALSGTISIEEGTETTEEEPASGDLGKSQDSNSSKEEDSKPAWRTGFGWLQVSVPVEPAQTPTQLIPQALGLSLQSASATSIENSSTVTDTAKAAVITSQSDSATPDGSRLDAFNATAIEVKPGESNAAQPAKQVLAPPLAFELKLHTEATSPAETLQTDPAPTAVSASSQFKMRPEMGSAMELGKAKAMDATSAATTPEPTGEEPSERPLEGVNNSAEVAGRASRAKDEKPGSDNHNSQSRDGGSHPHEPDTAGTVKAHNSSMIDGTSGARHERFTSDVRKAESAPSQPLTEAASLADSADSTPPPPVTSLRLHLESENSAMPVDLTVKERAGQVKIEVRDANLGRNIELQEQLPDLLKRLEEQGFRGEASGGVGREIALGASADTSPGSSSDQPQHQQHGSGEHRRGTRSDGEEDSPSQRNRQDRSKWQSAWFDMANNE